MNYADLQSQMDRTLKQTGALLALSAKVFLQLGKENWLWQWKITYSRFQLALPVSNTEACGTARWRPSAPPELPSRPGSRGATSQTRWATRSSAGGWGSLHSRNHRRQETCVGPQRWQSVCVPSPCRMVMVGRKQDTKFRTFHCANITV